MNWLLQEGRLVTILILTPFFIWGIFAMLIGAKAGKQMAKKTDDDIARELGEEIVKAWKEEQSRKKIECA